MKKSQVIGICVLVLWMVLSIFLLLIIPKEYGLSIWITLVFDVVAFVSQMIVFLVMLRGEKSPEDIFYRTPAMIVSIFYLIVQFCICIFMGIFGSGINVKIAVSVNFVVMILAWIILLTTSLSRDHIRKVDSRQKDNHIQL